MRSLHIEPWNDETFAPFGQSIEHRGTGPLEDLPSVFDPFAEARKPYCGLLCIDQPLALPHVVTQLERHPFSAQSFVPLVSGRYLAIVCPSFANNEPDIDGLRAFVVESPRGVTYNRNVWHHSVFPLSAHSQWLVLMTRTGRDDDNFFWTLEAPVRLASERAK